MSAQDSELKPLVDKMITQIGVLGFGEREQEMFYITTHSTHFIYGYMASDIWLRTILIVRKETRCRHIGYSYRLTARVLLYVPSHIQDNTYHSLCYTSCGALAGTRNFGRKEGNALNNALTSYLQLYGIRYMVKNHLDSKGGNPLYGPLFLISSNGSFVCTIPHTG